MGWGGVRGGCSLSLACMQQLRTSRHPSAWRAPGAGNSATPRGSPGAGTRSAACRRGQRWLGRGLRRGKRIASGRCELLFNTITLPAASSPAPQRAATRGSTPGGFNPPSWEPHLRRGAGVGGPARGCKACHPARRTWGGRAGGPWATCCPARCHSAWGAPQEPPCRRCPSPPSSASARGNGR